MQLHGEAVVWHVHPSWVPCPACEEKTKRGGRGRGGEREEGEMKKRRERREKGMPEGRLSSEMLVDRK